MRLVNRLLDWPRGHNKVTSGFKSSVRPGRRWRGPNPRQKGPCRSQGGLVSLCATGASVMGSSLVGPHQDEEAL
ncbi:hypothetical protein PoB_003748700 [Plakobranchus ocellatus]|uniref:Uncharacterized protein n=1 Tax=Plakobranchus ocellatus TaxID=259542 RepID=A0AAV4AVN2_9GAST|nr:hypothetical protein PoB_003748700 [Plakobranchus ocellatus]